MAVEALDKEHKSQLDAMAVRHQRIEKRATLIRHLIPHDEWNPAGSGSRHRRPCGWGGCPRQCLTNLVRDANAAGLRDIALTAQEALKEIERLAVAALEAEWPSGISGSPSSAT